MNESKATAASVESPIHAHCEIIDLMQRPDKRGWKSWRMCQYKHDIHFLYVTSSFNY